MLLYLTKRAVFTRLSPEISQALLQTTLNFILNVFHLEFYYKNQVHGSHHAPSNIFHQSVIILAFNICIWNLGLV